jgi:hypothetical protein
MEQLQYIREWGGKLVAPIPELDIFEVIFTEMHTKHART